MKLEDGWKHKMKHDMKPGMKSGVRDIASLFVVES